MSCIFCQIAGSDIPSDIVYKDDEIVAFNDINPEAPVHILIVPKKHISSLNEAEGADAELIGRLFLRASKIAKSKNLDKGYRLIVNVGREAGQTVDHIHIHLLGGRHLAWPPG